MSFPVDFHFGGIIISTHPIFELLAYSVGFRIFLYLRKKNSDPIKHENRVWILTGAAAGALLFSRLIGIFEDPVIWSNAGVTELLSNKTIAGGLAGGLIGTELTKKILNEKKSSGDLLTYPIIFAMIIGRIGCFLQGLNDGIIGKISTLPWAIDFGDGIRRHPVNLYEIMFLFLLLLFLKALKQKFAFKSGARFKIFMIAYFLFRFVCEFFKERYQWIGNLSIIQITSLIMLLYYYKIFFNPASVLEKRKSSDQYA
jgi:phosphatidylglycerol---prolipoprotein diacylglyceryl transferase